MCKLELFVITAAETAMVCTDLMDLVNGGDMETKDRGVGRGRALGAGAPPFSAKTTLRAPPSLMSLQPGNYWYRLVADKQHVQELAILY